MIAVLVQLAVVPNLLYLLYNIYIVNHVRGGRGALRVENTGYSYKNFKAPKCYLYSSYTNKPHKHLTEFIILFHGLKKECIDLF